MRLKSPKTDREADWFKTGFAPRKASLSIYLPGKMEDKKPFLSKSGLIKLADVDAGVLEQLIQSSLK